MEPTNLAQLIDHVGGNPADLLRQGQLGAYPIPLPAEMSNWRDEQEAWFSTAILFDQSFHMSDVYFKGPDVKKLFSETAVNTFETFGKFKAKQLVVTNYDGQHIADAICFGIADDEYAVVGTPAAADWLQFCAVSGGYDVEVARDDASFINANKRLLFRYQVQGPNALKIVEKAADGALGNIKFFNIGEFKIAGIRVRALNHTMIGVPGREHTGLEITGPSDDGPKVLAALRAAGTEFGMREGGALSYVSTALESGWIPVVVPAIYTGEQMAPYRQAAPAYGFEAQMSLGGSFVSGNIEDYYLTPYDLGYGRVVNFDHDFIGKEALQRIKEQPSKRKVWLVWNDDDVAALYKQSFLRGPDRAKFLSAPLATYSITHYDQVLDARGELVGFSNWTGYTVNHGCWVSLGTIDVENAVDGAEVSVIWGDPEGAAFRASTETNSLFPVRARVRTSPLV